MSDYTLIALSREVAALTQARDRLQQENETLKQELQAAHWDSDAATFRAEEYYRQLQALEAAASWQPKENTMSTESGWVIETGPQPFYWTGVTMAGAHERAIRFARRQDAEQMIDIIQPQWGSPLRAVEHGWEMTIEREAPPAASRREEEPR